MMMKMDVERGSNKEIPEDEAVWEEGHKGHCMKRKREACRRLPQPLTREMVAKVKAFLLLMRDLCVWLLRG